MRHLLLLGLAGATAFAMASGDPIVNSGFERNWAPSDPFFCVAGSTALPGWTVGGGTSSQGVDIRTSRYGPDYSAVGRQAVHLGGTNGPGSIKQTFPIDPFMSYIFSYRSSGLGYDGPSDTWAVYVNGNHFFSAGQANLHWYWSEMLIGAQGTTSLELEFRSLIPHEGVLLDEIHWFPVGSALMIGTVDLQDYDGNCDGQLATFEFHAIPSGDLIESQTVALEPGGRYELLLNPPGHCDVTVKTSHWLSYSRLNQGIGEGEDEYAFTVENGDCDEDNEVSIGDYSLLSSAFGSFDGDLNWNAMTDLNGDGAVDIGDYAILSQNYGHFGS